MRMRWLAFGSISLLLVLSGCRSRVAMTTEEAVPEDTTTHLNDKSTISLADWLKLPRAEQAKLVEEWTETVGKLREQARSNIESVQLLPQLHPPMVSVGFAEARFSPAAGFSLPPYVQEGQKDAAVALHLARFGDHEAALKLADPADKELLAAIDACRGERDYPIEWTRLASLAFQNAELKLANGDADGAAELVLLHGELRSLLDAKTASGALGAALLPRGRQALTLAATAWNEPRWNKTALAADIAAAVANWGVAPEKFPEKGGGTLFQPQFQPKTTPDPFSVQRTLDLLALPLPREGADGVAVVRDDKQTLTEWIVVYRPKLHEWFPEPRHLALPLLERGYKNAEPEASPGLKRQSWTGGGLSYEITVLTRGNIGGAVIRIAKEGTIDSRPSCARNPRDFGAANFDRSFEHNRLALAPEQTGAALEIKDAAKLAGLTQPAAKLATAVLVREAKADLLAKLTLRWPVDRNSNALRELAVPLWAAYGPARLQSAEEANGGSFALTWQNETTRLKLHLPFADQAPELLVEDSRGPDALKDRIAAAAEFDRRERHERLSGGTHHQRLARFVQLPSHGIDDLRLGMTRQQVSAVLPDAPSLRVQALADGLNILILNEPPARTSGAAPVPPYWPRQLFVRFGADQRVAVIRVRYQEGPRVSGAKSLGLFETLQAKPNGAPETLPATWAGLWTDLPGRSKPALYRWHDDVTCLTYQRDGSGSEVVLRDCPPDKPRGVELPPLRFCRRGVEGCVLGDRQADLRKRWGVRNPLLASNGAEVLRMPTDSPYDVLLVWYDNDKVARLIARFRDPKPRKPQEVGAALQQAWGMDLDHLGFVRRNDGARGQVMQSYGFHDDCTRVRLFAQETQQGIRIFAEWRDWPIAATSLASK